MILTPAQKQIAKDLHRFRVVCAGRRFGKSTLAVWEMFGKAVSQDDRRVVYIAPTYQQARDICWQELKKVCAPLAITINESRLEVTVKTQDGGKSTIWLRGWESIETLRGQRFDFIVIDEIAMMRNWHEHWQEVIRPTLTDRKGHVLFISTPKGFNHFYDLYNIQDSDYTHFHFTSYDNPHLPSEEIDKAKLEMTEDRFAQEYLADFRKQEGLVYKEFQRERDLFDDYTDKGRIVERIEGIDFGFTAPAVVLFIEKNYDGHYWITREWYKSGQTDDQIAEVAGAWKPDAIYPDPENPLAIEKMRQKGLNIREVIKGKDSITSGVNTVRELFKQGRIHVHKDCKNLIWELETLAYMEDYEDRFDGPDHACDALRYTLMMNTPVESFNDVEFGLYSHTYK